jgi:hypothetical protein
VKLEGLLVFKDNATVSKKRVIVIPVPVTNFRVYKFKSKLPII